MKAVSKLVANAALVTAKQAAGAASQWLLYQPKEPKELKAMVEKK